MHEEQGFFDALRERPEDDVTRLVYADWLEDRGDPRADYLRAEVALARMTEADEGYTAAEAGLALLGEDLDARWREQAGKRWDVVLLWIDMPHTIQVFKLLREATGEGLFRAKCMVENRPSVIVFDSSRSKAEGVKRVYDRQGEGGWGRFAIRPTREDDGYRLLAISHPSTDEFGRADEYVVQALDQGYARLAEVFGVLPEQVRRGNEDLPANLVDRATASQVAACLACCPNVIELVVHLRQDTPD